MAKHSTGVSSLGEDLDETYFPLNGFVHPPLDDRIKDSYETVVKTLGPITYVPFEFQYQVKFKYTSVTSNIKFSQLITFSILGTR